MRLEITKRADLAAQMLVVLARTGRRMKASEIAELLGTSAGFVPQILAPLIERSWVRSDPGPTGGYSSTVDLDTVSLLDAIEAVEGPTDTGRCVMVDRPCTEAGSCALHVPWARARASLLGELRLTPLSHLPYQEPAP
jgi:Rrf2 family iron-sulfur cluster assembly transcriptional regulator